MVNYATIRERDEKGKFIIPTIPSGFNKNQYYKNYYLLNKEKRLKQSLEWGRNNKEKTKKYKDKWRLNNKEKINFLKRLYIYRKKNADGKVSLKEIVDLYEKIKVCPYCNVNKTNTIDHIIPLSRGGSNNIDNLVPVCVNCNSSKGAKLLSEWDSMLFYQLNQMARAVKFNA